MNNQGEQNNQNLKRNIPEHALDPGLEQSDHEPARLEALLKEYLGPRWAQCTEAERRICQEIAAAEAELELYAAVLRNNEASQAFSELISNSRQMGSRIEHSHTSQEKATTVSEWLFGVPASELSRTECKLSLVLADLEGELRAREYDLCNRAEASACFGDYPNAD